MMKKYVDMIKSAYKSFNERNIDSALSVMDKNVHWPNGWEGGYVEGHDEVRAYWTRQWKEINSGVEPISFKENENGEIEVEVHQSAKDMKGNVLFDGMVKHIYTLKNGLIKSMEIKEG